MEHIIKRARVGWDWWTDNIGPCARCLKGNRCYFSVYVGICTSSACALAPMSRKYRCVEDIYVHTRMITSLGCLETGNTEEHGERQKLDYSPASIWTAYGLRRETFHRPLMINNAKFIEIRMLILSRILLSNFR